MTVLLAAATDAILTGVISALVGAAGAWAIRRAPKTAPETAIDEGTALVQKETARAREVDRWEKLFDAQRQENERLSGEVDELRSELDAERSARAEDRRHSEREIHDLRIELSRVRQALDAKH